MYPPFSGPSYFLLILLDSGLFSVGSRKYSRFLSRPSAVPSTFPIMQSIFQYRRLRQEVQDHIVRTQQAKRPASSFTGSSTAKSETAPQTDIDEESESAEISEKSTPSVDRALFPGVKVLRRDESEDGVVFVVNWKENDPSDPQHWSLARKWMATVTCCVIGIAMTLPTSVEGPAQNAFNAYYRVDPLAGSMTTGIFLIGIGVGSLFAGPFSETFGRNVIYLGALVLAMLFIMAKALAPNYGAAIAFRFLCALFAAAPMTVAGGTIGDVWQPHQIPFGLPFATFCAYSGPIMGPVVGAYTPEIGFAWADWISMLIMGATIIFVLLAQPETYGPLLLEWRAKHLRDMTGDSRYCTEHTSMSSLGPRLLTNLHRPFVMIWTEPIILVFTFYLVLLYFVLFTFLGGYEVIFTRTYDISTSLTYIIWVAMLPGVFIAMAMIPYIYSLTRKSAAKSMAAGKPIQPEVSLYWAMAGASILMPISLFWMAWTCYVRECNP